MKKAEEHLPTQTQRLSLQLPTPSEMQQSISYHLSPMKQPPASAFMFDEPHSMYRMIPFIRCREPSDRFAALFPFSDRIDTSELTLTNPVSLQQEQIYLNQMDTQLISGVWLSWEFHSRIQSCMNLALPWISLNLLRFLSAVILHRWNQKCLSRKKWIL